MENIGASMLDESPCIYSMYINVRPSGSGYEWYGYAYKAIYIVNNPV
jgi:hypothetical protein